MPIRVFVADDHGVVRDGLRLLFEAQEDITVVGEADDGRKAVRLVQQLCPDVVVMDIAMPELSGIEAANQIRETCPSTQVVILSMHVSREYVYSALRAGVLGYVLKESVGNDVVEAIRAVNAGRRYLSELVAETALEDYANHRKYTFSGSPLNRLSSREREVLQLVAEGKSSAEIAEILYLSPKTIATYRSRLMKKLVVRNLPSLINFAIRHGVIPPESNDVGLGD